MNQRLLAVTIALIAMTATAAPAQAGFGSSPGSRSTEMGHGGPIEWGEWIADIERPSEDFRGREGADDGGAGFQRTRMASLPWVCWPASAPSASGAWASS